MPRYKVLVTIVGMIAVDADTPELAAQRLIDLANTASVQIGGKHLSHVRTRATVVGIVADATPQESPTNGTHALQVHDIELAVAGPRL